MTRLAKSTHVVLREGADLMDKYAGPSYACERLVTLSEIARENKADAARLISALYNGLSEESELFGDGEASKAEVCE